MTAAELANKIGAEPINEPAPNREVTCGYTGDLLSRVMGRAEADCVWVTIMSNVNVVAVASLADVSAVVFAEDVRPDQAAMDAAKEHGINLYASSKPAFELCAEIQGLI
ncbi:MAG: hypothetical protein IJD14_01830 [Christensenellaceae bacterium]|nr:hypothetical protein [Christensenellaceae bacterium]